ncbi:Putative penicillin-binding protein PbpX [Caulifigura coniformis]|uniref:Penicillin-binding protein PbpX n=2 Tax=Caulifigura coniformis TaxID=2527983 RepID=A0A517SJ96_9PLAN|nr:Putative penicillin-binding protein PbpX [Caulifigura coniformis]
MMTGAARAADDAKSLSKRIDGIVTPLTKNGFSGCVLVDLDGDVIHRKGYGITDPKSKTKLAPTARFDIGSIIKPMVALATLELARLGTLQLDSKLGTLLKDVPEDKKEITVEQLLSHTGGISKSYDLKVDTMKRDAVVADLLKIGLEAPPGTKHIYSNANYFLMAAIIDVVDKRGYEDTMRELVFKPLNMRTARFSSDPPLKGEKVPSRFESRAAIGQMVPWPHGWAHRGATGVVCSVDDLLAFRKALDADSPIGPDEREDWIKIRKEDSALGWSVLSNPGRPKLIVHGGSSPGSKGLLAYYPEKDLTVVVLSNHIVPGNIDEWQIANSIRDLLFVN